jgi:sortase (surface protein transpeptidase)
MTRTARRAIAALAGALLVAGCGSSGTPPAAAPSTSVPITKPYKGIRPTEVRIPKIGAESSLLAVAVTTDGKIAVPSVHTPMQAAWYKLSPVPGDVGPAIVLGHVDGDRKPGIFYRLKDLTPGDEVDIDRSDGRKLKFVVDHVTQVPKETFPSDAVYGNSAKPELRLITCGGAFDHAAHSYEDNIIVYADLVS